MVRYTGGVGVKVFCTNCKYYFVSDYFPNKIKCIAFDNLEDTYRAPKSKTIHPPSFINQYNNCPWFEAKEEEKMKWWRLW